MTISHRPLCGCLSFSGNTCDCIKIEHNEHLILNRSDFTIEWFQYMENPVLSDGHVPRPFSIGSGPNTCIAAEITKINDMWVFHLWIDGMCYIIAPVDVIHIWVHFAIIRNRDEFKVYRDGIQIGDTIYNECILDYTGPSLVLGNESIPRFLAAFKGCISNFHCAIGTAIYKGEFTKPNRLLPINSDTTVMLRMRSSNSCYTDSSRFAHTVEYPSDICNIYWISAMPFSI